MNADINASINQINFLLEQLEQEDFASVSEEDRTKFTQLTRKLTSTIPDTNQISDNAQVFSSYIKALNRIRSASYPNFENLFNDYLEVGKKILGLELGLVANIESDKMIIYTAHSPEAFSRTGESFPIDPFYKKFASEKTYYKIQKEAFTLPHYPFELSAYLGVSISIRQHSYGVLEFVAPASQVVNFSAEQLLLTELIADDIGAALAEYMIYLERDRIEATKYAGKDQFRILVANLPGAVYRRSPHKNGIVEFISDEIEKITGYPASSFIGKTLFKATSIIHPDDMEVFGTSLANTIKKQGFYAVEYRVFHKNGSVRWVAERGKANLDKEKRVESIDGVLLDITDKKAIELALKESEELFRLITENANDLICLHQTGGNLIYVSPSAKELTGFEPAELQGAHLVEYVHQHDKEILHNALIGMQQHSTEKIEYRFRKKDGSFIWLETIVKEILDETGEVINLQTTSRDITERKTAEEQLKLLFKAIESSTNGIIISDVSRPDLPIIYTNPAFSAITGYSQEEVLGRNCKFLQAHETDQEALIPLRKAIKQGVSCNVLLRNYKKNGKLFFNNLGISPIYDQNGKLTHFLGIQKDITEQVRAEQAVVQSAANLNAIFESSIQGFILIDKEGVVLTFNSVASQLFHRVFNKKITEGKLLLNSLSEEYQEMFHTAMKQSLEGKLSRNERLFLTPDLQEYWLDIVASPVIEQGNNPEAICFSILDITDNKKNRLEILKINEQLRYIFNSLDSVFLSIDIKRAKIIQVSKAFEKTFGIHQQRLIKNPMAWKETILPEDLQMVELELSKLAKGSAVSFYFRISRPNIPHENRWIQAEIQPTLTSAGLLTRLDAIFSDITDRKKQDEVLKAKELAEKSLQFRSQFLANMSHEIRTPLNGILGLMELLMQQKLNEKQATYAKSIYRASQNLLTIINDILDLSKLEAGKMTLRQQAFPLQTSLQKISDLFQPHLINKQLDFRLELEPNLPEVIIGDESRLTQVLTNLIGNAIHFTTHGSITLKAGRKADNKLKLEVIDTGVGITIEDQQKLFQQFSQLDNSPTRTHGGTGLGLAISKELVHLMKGDIGVVSQPGKGSNFWFTITFKEASVSAIAKAEENNTGLLFPDVKYKANVLVVEDKAINQEVAIMMLEQLGCKYQLAANGKECMEIFTPNLFDLILMDIQMPVMDGVEAVKLLRQTYPYLPPIIGLSANAMKDDDKKFIQLGMDDYLAKPVSIHALNQMLAKWLNPERNDDNKENIQKSTPPMSTSWKNKPVVNTEVYHDLLAMALGNKAKIKDIFTSFFIDAKEIIEEMAVASEKKQTDTLKKSVHTLKGLCGTIGASRLHDILREMDESLKKSTQIDFTLKLQLLREELQNVQVFINQNN